jgi:hypothetical protein
MGAAITFESGLGGDGDDWRLLSFEEEEAAWPCLL